MAKNSTATKLPSQVTKIGNQAEALAEETGIKPGSKPVTVVETASAKIAEPAKVDPSDYKTRYSNYKATTDVTIRELRESLAARDATILELRGQVAQKPTVVASATPAKTESLAGTKNDPAYLSYLDKLPQSVKDEYTEDYLFDQFLIQTAANPGGGQSEDMTALNTKVDSVVKTQTERERELYLSAMDTAYPDDKWITLANGEQWTAFCKQRVSAVDNRTYGEIVEQGDISNTATTIIWVLQEYEKHLLTLEAGESAGDTTDTLEGLITPDSAGGGGDPITEINAQTESFTQSQVTQFFTDVATTKKYTAEEAQVIEKKIMAAQIAEKILPG